MTLGRSDAALWGECQGSGKNPYQVQIDVSEPAFKCSCPSRKFPCKHGIGLLLLAHTTAAAFKDGEPPDWVTAWLASRQARVEKQAKKAEEKPPDPAAQAKRAAQRDSKVAAGIREFDLWLSDLVRNGIADAASKSYKFWDAPAARLVDAQAAGLARAVRELAGIAASGAGWQGRMLARVARLHLLVQAYERLDSLPAPVQADVRTLIGWNQNQDEILARDGVRDRWLIVGQRVSEDDRITTQRTYLIGENTGRHALLLHFAFGGSGLDSTFPPGTSFDGEIAYFDSAWPLRALVKSRETAGMVTQIPTATLVRDATRPFADAIARFPWLDRAPVTLSGVFPMRENDRWFIRDSDGDCLPVAAGYEGGWKMLALSGGNPITVAGEWDGDYLLPLSVVVDGRLYAV